MSITVSVATAPNTRAKVTNYGSEEFVEPDAGTLFTLSDSPATTMIEAVARAILAEMEAQKTGEHVNPLDVVFDGGGLAVATVNHGPIDFAAVSEAAVKAYQNHSFSIQHSE